MDRRRIAFALRVVIGLLLLAGGAIHLHLWQSDYRRIPSQVPGVWLVQGGFVADAVVSLLAAVAVIALGRHWWVLLAVLGFQLGAIAAVLISHEGTLFGWQEHIWTSGAKESIGVEIATAVALVVALVLELVPERHARTAGAATA